MRIVVLSLPDAAERRRQIQNNIADLDLRLEFFPAIRATEEMHSGNTDQYSRSLATRVLGRALTLGELGCALSHLAIYQKMLDEGIEQLLVLEDDAHCKPSLPGFLQALDQLQEWELILLGHWSLHRDSMSSGAENALKGRFRVGDRMLVRPAEFPLGAYAYAIRQSAAKKLLDYFRPVRMPADYVTGGAELASVELRLVVPPLVSHRGLPSTIGSRGGTPEGSGGGGLVKLVKRLIRTSLLLCRKLGVFRKSYVWVFNQKLK